ncbi:hypothetical protein [Marinobacter salarius]|uniref:hypothetical protein n=1 Tax=Marinobacter salarius TaxID=1420917 RepID=UPI0012F9C1EB|nr:hypothetical protein [Marinobacter salarius]MCZ4284583.1 hypothetical protein [Marinobacter salarius]
MVRPSLIASRIGPPWLVAIAIVVVGINAFVFFAASTEPVSPLSQCVLREMPGTRSDHVAHAKYRECRRQHPAPTDTVRPGQPEVDRCITEHVDNTRSRAAQSMILRACKGF